MKFEQDMKNEPVKTTAKMVFGTALHIGLIYYTIPFNIVIPKE